MDENLKNSIKLALDALESCIMGNYGRDWIWPQSAHETAMIQAREAYSKLKESSTHMFFTYPDFIGDAIMVNSGEYEHSRNPLHTDMNAERWAKEFVQLNGGDEDLMRSWFANALMCGWDNHYWTTDEYKKTIERALNQE